MTDQNHKRIPLVWLIVGAVMIITLIYHLPAFASGNKQDVDVDVPVTVAVPIQGGTTSFKGSNSKAYAVSGADMDIRDCLTTESYVFGLLQRSTANKLCLAREAQQVGKVEEAAELRCSFWRVRKAVTGKWFRGKAACVTALTLKYVEPDTDDRGDDATPPEVTETDDDEDEYREEQWQMYEDLQAKVQNLEQAAPKVIYKTDPELKRLLEEDAARRLRTQEILEGKQ